MSEQLDELPPFNEHIGPHEGKELELMLSGQKPFARFSVEPGLDPDDVEGADFARYVEPGKIVRFIHIDDKTGVESRYYALPTEEWRIKLSHLLSQMCMDGTAFKTFNSDDLHRIDGALLGYAEESVEAFLERSKLVAAYRAKTKSGK